MDRDTLLKRIAIIVVAVLATAYVADYLLLRLRVALPSVGAAFGNVTDYSAASLKDGKVEVFFDQPQAETCVHSLFPHLGDRPCWYANRNSIKLIQ
jgi:hypothetical protein